VGLELKSADIDHDCRTLNVAAVVKMFVRYETVLLERAEVLAYFSMTGLVCHFWL
jgi:hypothetical protein